MEIKKVGVLGCGLMGSGIAQVSATAGFDVTVLEVEQKFIEKGFSAIRNSLDKLAAKNAIAESTDAIFARLKGTARKEDLADCDFIVEAVIENLEEKSEKMFASIDHTRQAFGYFRQQYVFDLHHRNHDRHQAPRPVRGSALFQSRADHEAGGGRAHDRNYGREVFDTAFEFGKKLGKVPVRTSDKTGFIVNRLFVPYLLDAVRAFEEGVGSIARY